MRQDENKMRPNADKSTDAADLNAIMQAIRVQKLPPVESWNPEHCGKIDIRIAGDGRWFHQGSEIKRPEMVRLFSTVLRRDGDTHLLVTPVEKLEITVEDAPFLAVEMIASGTGREQLLAFRTNVGDHVVAGPDNPITLRARPSGNGGTAPYVRVRGGLDALISRPVYYELAELAVGDDAGDRQGVWSQGAFFPLEAL